MDTIVVGIDFSQHGERALAHAEGLARDRGAELVLVHATGVSEDGMYVYEVAGRLDEPWKAYVHARVEHSREQLESLTERCRRHGVKARSTIVQGFADVGVVEAAKEVSADLVVVGTHGRTGVERWLLGSVAERVVRTAECPVLVVREGAYPEGGHEHILVPVDLSPTSARAVKVARTFLAPSGRLTLLHVWQPPSVTLEQVPPSEVWEGWVERAHEAMESFVRDLGDDVPAKSLVEEGVVAKRIQAHLDAGSFGLVAMGSHGRRGVRRWILGSVAEQVTRYAEQSVLVVHGS